MDQNLVPRAIAAALALFALDFVLGRRYVPASRADDSGDPVSSGHCRFRALFVFLPGGTVAASGAAAGDAELSSAFSSNSDGTVQPGRQPTRLADSYQYAWILRAGELGVVRMAGCRCANFPAAVVCQHGTESQATANRWMRVWRHDSLCSESSSL